MIQKPVHAAGKFREVSKHRRLQHFDGKQRDQAHGGTNFQREALSVRQTQTVVIKFVCGVPQSQRPVFHAVDGGGDVQEMLEELGGDVFIDVVVTGQFQRDAQQVQAIHRHPTGGVGLGDVAAGRQRFAAVKDADVVQTQKAALKNVPALRVFA